MKEKDRLSYITRYEGRLSQFGYSPKTLGWGEHGRQDIRFSVLAEYALKDKTSSVFDVGCGFADLYDYLIERDWRGTYCGIDIVPGLLEVAKKKHPNLNLFLSDISTEKNIKQKYDYVISSGIFNAKLTEEDNKKHIEQSLYKMFTLAKKCVCVDFLSTFVDFQNPLAFHTDPGWIFSIAKKISKRIILRHDYMPYEFSIFILCNDSTNSLNTFEGISSSLKERSSNGVY